MNKKDFLKSHPKIEYWLRAIKYAKDPKFVQICRAIYRDPNLLYFVSRGNEYPDVFFYDILIDAPSKGFFALLNQTLDGLKYADRHNLIPVVTWSDSCLYKDDGEVNGSVNPFCYYFEIISGMEQSEIQNAKNVLEYNYGQRALDIDHPFGVVAKTIVDNGIYDSYIQESADVYRKYIKFKPQVLEIVEKTKQLVGFGDSVLGVHVRATDFSKGYINHAVMNTIDEYIEAVKKALKKESFDKIFLATDDASVIGRFEEVFPGMIIYNSESFRSSDGNAVHFSASLRKHHKYLLGIEVISDMYLLSICNGLIGGYSNVCICAQIAKKSYGIDYDYLNILDKGFNQTGKTTLQDHLRN